MTYHMQQCLRLMSGYMQLNNDFNVRAIEAPSFSKHHKSHSGLCYRLVIMTLERRILPAADRGRE